MAITPTLHAELCRSFDLKNIISTLKKFYHRLKMLKGVLRRRGVKAAVTLFALSLVLYKVNTETNRMN